MLVRDPLFFAILTLRHTWTAALRRLRERLDAWRVERQKDFPGSIGRAVPRSRDLFRGNGFPPATIWAVAELQRFPLTAKATMRAAGGGLEANYLMFNGFLYLLGSCYEKLIGQFHALRFLRGWIMVELRKPVVARSK